jgi:alpha-tubulin suppressor-like RCC1 family protein
LRIRDVGARGWWTVGTPITLRWRERGLRRARVTAEISRDGGATWRGIGDADARLRSLTYVVDEEAGHDLLLRVRSANGRVCSRHRPVSTVAPVREISIGLDVGVALHEDGQVRLWGNLGFDYPPLRDASVNKDVTMVLEPYRVPDLSDVRTIAAGDGHVVAVKNDGSVWLWVRPFPASPPGYPPLLYAVPRQVEGVENAVWVRAGSGRTFIQVADGRVFGLGGIGQGMFGGDDPVPPDVPTEWPSVRGAVDIEFGRLHALALATDGTVLAVGVNSTGQLGEDGAPSRHDFEPVPGVTDCVAIAARDNGSVALRRDGTVLAWGQASADPLIYRTPTVVPGIDHIVAIGCADLAAYALRDDGLLFAWGLNGNGELGDGTTVDRLEPKPCLVPNVARFYVGEANVQVITADGQRYAWGDSIVGDGSFKTRLSPVPVYSR